MLREFLTGLIYPDTRLFETGLSAAAVQEILEEEFYEGEHTRFTVESLEDNHFTLRTKIAALRGVTALAEGSVMEGTSTASSIRVTVKGNWFKVFIPAVLLLTGIARIISAFLNHEKTVELVAGFVILVAAFIAAGLFKGTARGLLNDFEEFVQERMNKKN